MRLIKACASSSVEQGYTVVIKRDFSTTYSWRNSFATEVNSTIGLIDSHIHSPPLESKFMFIHHHFIIIYFFILCIGSRRLIPLEKGNNPLDLVGY